MQNIIALISIVIVIWAQFLESIIILNQELTRFLPGLMITKTVLTFICTQGYVPTDA